jgi:hypothetical protein
MSGNATARIHAIARIAGERTSDQMTIASPTYRVSAAAAWPDG